MGLWRWRGNPLCRRTDRGEAWAALCALVLIVVGAPLAGLFGGAAAHTSLLHTAAEQRQERHLTWAGAQSVADRLPRDTDPESAAGADLHRQVVDARWTAPDGSTRTGPVDASTSVQPGDRFRIWTDDRGQIAARPLTDRTASSHAVLAGLAAAAGAAGLVECGRRLALRQQLRRRYAGWEAEWQRIGPDWGRTGTNS